MQRHSKAVEPTVPRAELMWNIDPQSIEAVTKPYTAWFRQAKRMRDETMRFATERFTKEIESAVQLARCTNPSDAFALQAKFTNEMAQTTSRKAKELSNSWARWPKKFPRVPSPTARPGCAPDPAFSADVVPQPPRLVGVLAMRSVLAAMSNAWHRRTRDRGWPP